jgi:hypothetical protein
VVGAQVEKSKEKSRESGVSSSRSHNFVASILNKRLVAKENLNQILYNLTFSQQKESHP